VRRTLTGRLILFAQIAGLAAMAWFVWANLFVQRHLGLRWFLARSLVSVLLLWAASALLTFYVYLLISHEDPREAVPLSIRSSAPGMWFAPAMLLLSGVSPIAFVVSLLLAINTARVLVSRWPIRAAPPLRLSRDAILSATTVRTGFVSRKSLPALTAAFLILAGITAKMWRFPLTSAIFLVGGASIITALSLITGATAQRTPVKAPPSLFAIVLTILLSSMLSVGVFQVQSAAAAGAGAGDAPQQTTRLYDPAATSSGKDSFPGVVLRTEPKKQPPITARSFFSRQRSLAAPQWIEFSGEYWMLRPRYDRPPPDALVSHNSPLDFIFRTTDALPMKMEAHQPLENPIDLACCASIQVVIDDADHHAGTIALELILWDGARSLSLGARVIDSEARQTVDFPVPRDASLRRFNQIEVVFHRDPIRADRSANISILRFVLVPVA